ncbi:2'-5' RNA ligase family protein [Bosea minatitlanensis]|uniref:2'-5' RNA ligase family protein n=1 Tax=Bosea minatitlanensis TaxID=128782 RepID=A0ABW0F172_9HYPH
MAATSCSAIPRWGASGRRCDCLSRVCSRWKADLQSARNEAAGAGAWAIYDDDAVREAEIRRALDNASKNLRAVTLTFDAICSFDGPPMVLWASPRPSAVLRAIHGAIHAAINPTSCRPHYRPGAWKPHCTLGTQVRDDQREAALAFARRASSVFDVIFDSLD